MRTGMYEIVKINITLSTRSLGHPEGSFNIVSFLFA